MRLHQRPHTRSATPARKAYRMRRLDGAIEVPPLLEGIDRLPADAWIDSQWKWHLGTRFCILRGGPPHQAPGSRLTSGGGIDAPALRHLPRLRALLDTAFPVPAALAWIGASPPGARICTHVDNTAHWDEHHRLHLPLRTSPGARLSVAGRWHHLPAGTLWAMNNSLPHAAANDGPLRLHLMVDLPDTDAVRAWIAAGSESAGVEDPALTAAVNRDPLERLAPHHLEQPGLLARLLDQ